MKSKVEPVLSTLREICNGLSCYNVLSLIRANSDIFYAVICPNKVFTWTYELFQQLIKPRFSENGCNKRNAEVCVYKYFIVNAFSWIVRFSYFNLPPKKCF